MGYRMQLMGHWVWHASNGMFDMACRIQNGRWCLGYRIWVVGLMDTGHGMQEVGC